MRICWCFCGSFCTVRRAVNALKTVVGSGNTVIPVGSFAFMNTDTRFGRCREIVREIEDLSGNPMIGTLEDAEPVGPVLRPDLTVIAPATGNTLAKLACGIYDTPVTLAAKAHLRQERPLLIALATNDALSGNFENIARLFTRKNIFFVPMRQDDPVNKPFSMVCDFERIPEAIDAAAKGVRLPVFG